MSKKDEKKGSNSLIIGLIALALIIILILLWLFLKFNIKFKYNNGEDDFVTKVRMLMKVNKDDVRNDLVYEGHTFIGYFETYLLSEKQINSLESNSELANTICKNGFKLSDDKIKCVANNPFDFDNTRIMQNKTIEAMWSNIDFYINPTSKTINKGSNFTISTSINGTNNNVVNWSSQDSSIATVDSDGKVVGVKVGKTNIIAEFYGIKRTCVVTVVEPDNSKISLSSNKKCIIGSSSATLTAKLTNASKFKLSWATPNCFKLSGLSDTVKTLIRDTSCSNTSNLTGKVTAKLSNGKSASVNVTYEPTLDVKVYNYGHEVTPSNDRYYANNVVIKTNTKATFSGSGIYKKDSTSATLNRDITTTITVKTSCGQTKTINIVAVIN